MISEKNLFQNYFSDTKITPNRLYNFALNTIGKLNAVTKHSALATTLIAPTENLANEIGEVSSSIAIQKSSTKTNNQVLTDFKLYMSENEGVLRKTFGGKNSTGYTQMYPQGISQYTLATKTNMVNLLKQVFDAATNNASKLDAETINTLKGFTQQWNESREQQNNKKGKVEENRVEKSANRTNLEMALLVALHKIAAEYPGDVATCSSFFDFSLLESAGRKAKPAITTKGDIK